MAELRVYVLPNWNIPRYKLSYYVCPKCSYCGKRFYEAIYTRLRNFKYLIEGDGFVRYLTAEGDETMAEHTIATKVAELIKDCGADVETEVVEALVGREVKRRSEALVTAIDELAKRENDLKRLKPDIIQQDEDGKEISATYSPAKAKERKELKEKIAKYTNAINKALGEKHDFSDVYNLSGSAKTSQAGTSPEPHKGKGDGQAE